jgi:hypothetical protein
LFRLLFRQGVTAAVRNSLSKFPMLSILNKCTAVPALNYTLCHEDTCLGAWRHISTHFNLSTWWRLCG